MQGPSARYDAFHVASTTIEFEMYKEIVSSKGGDAHMQIYTKTY